MGWVPFRTAFSWLLAAFCAAASVAGGSAVAAPISPFTYVLVDVFAGGPTDGTSVVSSATDPVFVERGMVSGAYGKARADFGSNGFAAQSGAAGLSLWSDGFVVNGGTGSGQITVSVLIDGVVLGSTPDMSYSLFLSSNPFDAQSILDALAIDDQDPQVPDSSTVLHTEIFHSGFHPEGAISLTLRGIIPFTYGQTFYLASLFGGDVGLTGHSEDFFSSADFGITAPGGSTLVTQSHTVYASAVPEPGMLALVALAVLCVLFWRGRAAAG
jgi:hypothetical protein